MSDPTDIKSAANGGIEDDVFDAYLGRESEVSKRYRALGSDEVPAALDRSVLAQARAAVADRGTHARKRPAWMRWTAPLALAASAVLVVSIVIRSGTRHEVSMQDASTLEYRLPEAPAATASSEAAESSEAPVAQEGERDVVAKSARGSTQAAPPPPATQALDAAAPAPAREESKERRALKRQEPALAAATGDMPIATSEPIVEPPPKVSLPALAAPTPAVSATSAGVASNRNSAPVDTQAQADTSGDLSEIVMTAQRRSRQSTPGAGPRGSVPPVAAGNASDVDEEPTAALEKQLRESNPGDWLAHIRQLRLDRKSLQADREWRRFLDAYPQYPVDPKDAARPKP